jgi:hypothetical protein
MTLPDTSFFLLLRTVFGKIKTPFNKQLLMGDLENFLLNKDIQKNIACYIDDNDIRVIAAVAVLNDPAPNELGTFFAGELSYAELCDLIINLEERFILYRFPEKVQNHKVSRLALNPVLESVLSPLIAEKSLLFSSLSADEAPHDENQHEKPQYFIDDRILAALLSFVSQNKVYFKGEGGGGRIRQKVLNAAKPVFPDMPLETIIGGLRVLGLFFIENEQLVPDYQRFAAFGNLNRQERLIYCAAGIQCYADSLESAAPASLSPWLLRVKVRNYAEMIGHLYNSLDPELLYPHITLRKLAYMQERTNAEKSNDKISDIINIMEKIGLIVSGTENYWRKASFAKAPAHHQENTVIVMDTPFTLLLYPEIAYNDAITLAAFSVVIEAGMTTRFELNRDSAVLAFNRGLSANTLVELLLKLSNNRIDESLLFTLRDWEKRYGEVTLRRGLVLTLSPDQRHLAETRQLARLIAETLAPGIYMLPESAEEKAVDALHKAGVAIIARRREYRAGDAFSGEMEYLVESPRNFFQPLYNEKPQTGKKHCTSRESVSSASALTDQFHSILKQMRQGKEECDELTARIDRRLVLCESQLKDAVVRYEKLEARGLDYVGKAMIAKQAISMQAPVEVIWPGKNKQQERLFGIPKALEKSESESILIIDSLDDKDMIRLSLGKIISLRRIKKSIFEV